MATRARGLYRGGAGLIGQFHLEATVVAGEIQVRNANAATAGEIEDPTTTAAADCLGVTMEASTYSTTQADFDGMPGYKMSGEEGTVAMVFDPLQVLRLVVSGGATAGTALATGTPANVLVEEAGDATGLTITEGAVGTVDMDGGLVIGRTGGNGGIVRRLTVHTNSTNNTVIVPFPRAIAIGDTFIRVPYSKSAQAVQLTTNFVEANGIIAYGTGAPFAVIDVDFDVVNDAVAIECVALDHQLNPA